MSTRRHNPYKQIMTLQAISTSALVLVTGIALISIANLWHFIVEHPAAQNIVDNIGGSLIAGVALVLIWELRGRRSFTREILHDFQYANDIENSGIVRIGTEYLSDPAWDELFAGVNNIDLYIAYGSTWRQTHLGRLRAFASSSKNRLRIYLPDVHDATMMSSLARRFDLKPEELIRRINDAAEQFADLRAADGARVEVYAHSGDTLFSCYRFDNKAVLTFYTNTRKRGPVPTIVCQVNGSIYDYLESELRAIHAQSRVLGSDKQT